MHCNAHIITALSIATKNYDNDLFNAIDDYYWRSKCVDNFNVLNLSWYDLYCSLSTEKTLKNRFLLLRKRYIEVANCCKCRIYCKSCSNPITESGDVEIKCPHCDETSGIDEYEILYYSLDNPIGKRGSISYLCKECQNSYHL